MVDAAQVNVELAPEDKTHIFGVDLGSQRCVVASHSGDIVLNELGGMTTATLVSFKGDERLIGEAAVLSSSTNPKNTVDYVNLFLGIELAFAENRLAKVPGQHAVYTQATTNGNSGVAVVVDYLSGSGEEQQQQQQFTVEQLMGMLLGKLAQQMRKKLRDDELAHVNIAVPSTWGLAEKKALHKAAKIAGLPSVSIVTRGSALARCFHRKHPLQAPPVTDSEAEQLAPVKHIVIMDMGHTSTSIAAVKLTPEGETVLAETGDVALGSENFDLYLYEHFKRQVFENLQISVNHSGKEGKRLLQSCERLKKLLSTIGEASVSVENIVQDRDYTLKTTRDVFEQLCAEDTKKIQQLLAKVVADAKLSVEDIASVEIVGGGTRIPLVQNAILKAFGGRDGSFIGRMLDSTTSVAVGAAALATTNCEEDEKLLWSEDEQHELELLAAKEAEMQDRDTELAAIAHERNAIEAFVYEMRSKQQDTTLPHVQKLDFQLLNPLLEQAEDWIYSEESENATLDQVRTKHLQIRTQITSVCSDYFHAIHADEQAFEAQLEDESRRAEAERDAEGAAGNSEDHDTRKLKKPERMRLVVKNKEEGNELFKGGNYAHAAMRYVKSLSHATKFFDLNQKDLDEVATLKLSLYLNLAQCYLKMENWPKAIANCSEALALDPQNAKALYRRAFAYEKQKNVEAAVVDIKNALKVAPDDKAVLKLDDKLKQLVKRQVEKEKKMWSRAFA